MVQHKMNYHTAILLITMSLIILFSCYNQPTQSVSRAIPSMVTANNPSGPCIDVAGIVLGSIKPGSKVYLYNTSSLNFSVVMAEIRNSQVIMQACVNATNGFKFGCLYPGKYALVIPTTSYYWSKGAPLPYEFDCTNVSVRIAFQGGDSEYMVGAFSIIQPAVENKTSCEKDPFSCLKKRGGLYIKCPLDQE